jgi:hypothetical protein
MHSNHRTRVRKIAAPCRHCGTEFFAGKRNGRRREFCSNACRQAHFRNAEFERRYQRPDPILSPSDWPIDVLGGSPRGSEIHLATVKRFLTALDREAPRFTFQTLDDDKQRKKARGDFECRLRGVRP